MILMRFLLKLLPPNTLHEGGEDMSKFWVPSTKRELVKWLTNHFKGVATGFNKMDKKQLYAIYFNVRNNNG